MVLRLALEGLDGSDVAELVSSLLERPSVTVASELVDRSAAATRLTDRRLSDQSAR
jgi:hypothetical protein